MCHFVWKITGLLHQIFHLILWGQLFGSVPSNDVVITAILNKSLFWQQNQSLDQIMLLFRGFRVKPIRKYQLKPGNKNCVTRCNQWVEKGIKPKIKAYNEFAPLLPAKTATFEKSRSDGDPLAILCPIWSNQALNLKPSTPETNAVPLDHLNGKSDSVWKWP